MNKKRKGSGKPESTGIWVIFIVVFIAELFFYTWCRVQYVRSGYDISKKTGNHKELIALNKKLKIELASLKSPERIAEIARQELDLVMPKADQMIEIGD